MKQTLIAAAVLLATAGAVQAQTVVGDRTATNIIVGASTVNAGPHTAGKPGIGVDGSNVVDLGGIDLYTYKDSATVSNGVAFRRYQLLGYTHQDDEGGTVSQNLNWYKVPTISQQVYFGIVTNPATTTTARSDTAFAVGDQTGFVVPTSATSYAAAGALVPAGYTGTTPVALTGTLNLATSASGSSLSGSLSGSTGTLNINPTGAVNVDAVLGTFGGASSYVVGATTTTGSTSGHFYGSGSTSAVAGVASGSNYTAAFGGIKN